MFMNIPVNQADQKLQFVCWVLELKVLLSSVDILSQPNYIFMYIVKWTFLVHYNFEFFVG